MSRRNPGLTGAAERSEPRGGFSAALLGEFFRKSVIIAMLFTVILSIAIPAVMYAFEMLWYKEDSVHLLRTFVDRELGDAPWDQFRDPAQIEELSQKIRAYMEISNLIEFKVWRRDGMLFYSFHDPDMQGKKFEKNEELEEMLRTGETSVEVADPSHKAESKRLSEHQKLFEIYVPIVKQGKVVGAVEIYRVAPSYRFFGAHTLLIVLIAGLLFILLHLFMRGTFRKTSQKILDYDRKLGSAYLLLGQSYFDTVSSLIKALEMRDMETEGHSQRVVALSMYFGEKMSLDMQERQKLLLGAYLHDIGKIGIPDSILLKPGRLDQGERDVMMTHIAKGYEVIKDVETLKLAADVVLYHHEKWDGSGYAKGLKGEEIPVVARIFSLVDVFDALRNRRPYKEALTFHDTRDIINGDSGSHFDPQLVSVFNSMTEDEIARVVSKESLMNISAMIKNIFQSGL